MWFGKYKRGLEVYGDHAEALRKKREERKECLVVGYYRSSVPTFGLFFGSDYVHGYFIDALEKVHPEAVHYRPSSGQFRDWSAGNHTAEIERYVSEGGCVLVQGGFQDSNRMPGWQLRPVLLPENKRHEALYELSLDSLNPALLSAEDAPGGAVVLEAEEFLRGNVGSRPQASVTVVESADTPAFAEYEWKAHTERRAAIRIRYASAESHPLKVYLNGKLIMGSACHVPTGGDEPSDQKWHDLGMYRLEKGENLLRLETDGEFPLVDKIAVKRVPG